ncbi:hypothetical protein SB49_02185 [Sediminicola sp. YIK13]|nr:hypothetical protein SB49_02185 [Sediminicola sp. YIK13]
MKIYLLVQKLKSKLIDMQLSKSTLLSIAGMVVLALFVTFCYVNDSIFLDRILISSFILSIVFLVKIREDLHQSIEDNSKQIDNNLPR